MRRTILAVLTAIAFIAPFTIPGFAMAASCAQAQYVAVQQDASHQQEFLNRDAFNGGTNCITNHGGTDNFVTSGVQLIGTGWVRAYPNLMVGCNLPSNGFYGACTARSGLPRRVVNIPHATVAWYTSHTGVIGHWNTGIDVWTSNYRAFNGPSCEIMVWLNERNIPPPANAVHVVVAGKAYLRWTRPAAHWTEIIYLRQPQTTGVASLALGAILGNAAAMHVPGVGPNTFVQQIAGGFEMWRNGNGLRVSEFRVSGA